MVIAFIISGCDNCDFSIPENKRALLADYEVGETIYFQSQKGDIDTISIVRIDSLEECGSIMAGKRKHIAIEIKYLPLNKWTGGTELSQNGEAKILNQDLIVIEKQFDEKENYWIGINYRDFLGEINENNLKKDDYLIDLGINEYWEIENEASNWRQYKNDSSVIVSLIWTKKYGLTEYKKRNGEILKINKP